MSVSEQLSLSEILKQTDLPQYTYDLRIEENKIDYAIDEIKKAVKQFLWQYKLSIPVCEPVYDCPICKDQKSRMEYLEFLIEESQK